MYVEYDSNNSGGSWWLKDDHWKKLEEAGWKVAWASLEHVYSENGYGYVRDEDGTPKLVPVGEGNSGLRGLSRKDDSGAYRYMGALARNAYRAGLPLREAAEEWERVTGMSATDPGCACCGQPHTFTQYDDAGEQVDSGPHTNYSAGW